MKSPIYGCPGFAAGIWGQSKNTWIKPATSDNVSIFTLTLSYPHEFDKKSDSKQSLTK